jgi:enoyl-CoA hydratase/carnithine racemase
MADLELVYEKAGRIAYITLNRPEALNALNASMLADLKDALSDFDHDPDVWVAIVGGRGSAFCVGADLRQFGEGIRVTTSRTGHYLLDAPVNWKPVIATVHGYCYGYGLSFAAECDLIVATEDAGFCMVETRRGMPPVTISAQLAAWMGSKRVTEMILTGDPLPAQEAYRLGLVNRVVATPEELRPTAEELAQRIIKNPPLGVRTAVQASRTSALQSEAHREAELLFRNTRWQESEDHKESISAFLENRPPVFTGR